MLTPVPLTSDQERKKRKKLEDQIESQNKLNRKLSDRLSSRGSEERKPLPFQNYFEVYGIGSRNTNNHTLSPVNKCVPEGVDSQGSRRVMNMRNKVKHQIDANYLVRDSNGRKITPLENFMKKKSSGQF